MTKPRGIGFEQKEFPPEAFWLVFILDFLDTVRINFLLRACPLLTRNNCLYSWTIFGSKTSGLDCSVNGDCSITSSPVLLSSTPQRQPGRLPEAKELSRRSVSTDRIASTGKIITIVGRGYRSRELRLKVSSACECHAILSTYQHYMNSVRTSFYQIPTFLL